MIDPFDGQEEEEELGEEEEEEAEEEEEETEEGADQPGSIANALRVRKVCMNPESSRRFISYFL